MDAVRIEDVVSDFVNLKRRGVNMVGLCPFHQEKTPSFNVLPAKNIFKCFGCGQGGDTIQFLREHDGFSYEEALRYLARKYHIEVEETMETYAPDPEQQQKDAIWIINQFARDFFVDQLWNQEEGKNIGLSYFKERGLREATIRKFDLGYAPASGSSLAIHGTQAGHKPDLLKAAGLINDRNTDFFRERVMFTIHSLTGKPQAFAGRVMGKTSKGPKYINSPETLVYHKSKVLYGLYQARTAIRNVDECYLVEGYTDVLTLSQEGIENVVASSGTALTVEQIHLIRRFTENITILYDGDKAGQTAALRGLDLILEQGLNVRLVLLPDGYDPDSYISSFGKETFVEYLRQNRKDFILFKTHLLLDAAQDDPAARAKVIKDIVLSIAKIADQLKRAEYTKSCARIMSIDEEILIQEVNKHLADKIAKERRKEDPAYAQQEQSLNPVETAPSTPAQPQGDKHHLGLELNLARILINGGHKTVKLESLTITVASYILQHFDNELLEKIPDSTIRKVFTQSKEAIEQGLPINPAYFIDHPDREVHDFAMLLLTTREEYSENWEKKHGIILHNQPMPDNNYDNEAVTTLKHYMLKLLKKLSAENLNRIETAHLNGDLDQCRYYMKLHQQLNLEKSKLAKELNIVVLK